MLFEIRTIAHSTKSVGHIFLFFKDNINICVVDLIVGDSLSIVPIFWMGETYSNSTVHSIVLLIFETTLTTLKYLAYFD